MNTNDLNAAWAAVNTKAQALADRANAGATLDELVFERAKLFREITEVMRNAELRQPIMTHDLNRLLDDLTGANVHYAMRFRNIRRAVDRIAMLRHAIYARSAA